MSKTITTKELENALEKLAIEMGISIKEYLDTTKPVNVKPAKDTLRKHLGLHPRDS
jgi:hypothetical protein